MAIGHSGIGSHEGAAAAHWYAEIVEVTAEGIFAI
jgi:hypothetical protein